MKVVSFFQKVGLEKFDASWPMHNESIEKWLSQNNVRIVSATQSHSVTQSIVLADGEVYVITTIFYEEAQA